MLAGRPSRDWIEGLEKLSVSCGPINTLDQVFADPQVEARDMKLQMHHPLAGDAPVPLIASPMKMSATPPSYGHPPPLLGEHSDQVLQELLGLGPEELATLREGGVI